MPGYTNPQNLNRYSYVRNNPIKYIDPSGHGVDCGIGMGCVTPYTPPNGGNGGGGGGGNNNDDDDNPGGGGNHCDSILDCEDPDGDLGLLIGLNPNSCTGYTCSLPPSLQAFPTTQTTSTQFSPDYNQIVAGVLLLGTLIVADAVLIVGLVSIPEIEATMLIDAVATGVPIVAALHDVHAYALDMIIEGITGQGGNFNYWLDPTD